MSKGSYRETLRAPGLLSFLTTQFLGAFNDNVSKIIVSFAAQQTYGDITGPAVVAGVFIFPFLIFSGYAGYLADRFSKRTILRSVKVLEIGIMSLGVIGLLTHHLNTLLAVMFMMGVHSTFFGPSKYGIVPEIVKPEHMSTANGLLEMSTFAAIVLGTAVGGSLYLYFEHAPWIMGAALVAIAIAGFLTSFGIPRVRPANPSATLSINPFAEVWRGSARMWPDRTLWMTMIGISYFWFLGALLQTALLPFGQDVLGVGKDAATRLYTPLAVGIATGSLAAGRLSGDKIELGLVPLGAFGLGLFSFVLAFSPSYWLASAVLVVLGFFGGLFAVPLNALLQHKPDDAEKGRIQATNNFFNTLGILLAAGLLGWLGGSSMHVSIRTILVGAAIFTLLSSGYILFTLPDFFVRFVLWMLTHTLYRIKIVGKPHVPTKGPALIICNHVSMIDGALVGACIQRFVRFIVYGPIFKQPGVHALLSRMHAIPIVPGSRRGIVEAIDRARQALEDGHVVCIFAEGSVSRTGNLLPFKRGFEKMVDGLSVPIIPVYLDRVWGSIFSFKGEKFFWKRPERLPYPVTVMWGAPMPPTTTAAEARRTIMELGVEAMKHRRKPTELLHVAFMRAAKRHWRRLAMADSTGTKLTYGRALVGALLLGRAIERRTAGDGSGNVGILLPASVGGALANIAVMAAGKVPVNLNFTSGTEAMAAAVQEARIKTILTSRVFLKKASLDEMPGMVFLEELRKDIGGFSKVTTLLAARLLPVWLLRRMYGGLGRTSESLGAIIFSSGSTGVPKGVMISHGNILANVDSLAQIFPMDPSDCFIGVLPFFHSFGLTGTLWFPLLQGSSLAYHPNPMDAKTIGEMAETYGATMLISTPTFCNAYVRKITKEQFAKLKYAIVGAEKLRPQIAAAFTEKYGIELLEGYGCTEMSPVVAVNRPNIDIPKENQIGTKSGSVGHPIPGVAAKVVDQTTGEGALIDAEGLILVKGANLMQGYLNHPERTAEVVRDGWYVTGDIGKVDEDGFIFITDRLSRFSKIGGEMVPHLKIEDAINTILGDVASAVTAVPDASKGERLVAFYTTPNVTPEELWAKLGATELPKLWIPRRDNLIQIEAIPTLGTGKVDLRRLKQLALESTPASGSRGDAEARREGAQP